MFNLRITNLLIDIIITITSFDEALRWHSYDTIDITRLQMGIMTSINVLFERLEKQHGQMLVVFALSYLTLCK